MSPPSPSSLELFTPQQVATLTKLKVATVWKKCRTNEWPYTELGRHYRFTADQIEQIIRPEPAPAAKKKRQALR